MASFGLSCCNVDHYIEVRVIVVLGINLRILLR